jgi:poly-gamma-glutamate capsule biosynthesis protein CapA/YwtB (metallophosphatase superfamily)
MPDGLVTLFLCGDVMLGRGVDQILPYPGDPKLRERYVRDARTYVELAEQVNGPIPRPVEFSWPWGEARHVLDEAAPDVRVVNLETSITRSNDFARGKGIHYRMNPQNVPCLAAARPDACGLANNHVLDFGVTGLQETLDALSAAGLQHVGAGRDATEAQEPAAIAVGAGGRALIVAFGMASSGIPSKWAATSDRPGVNFVPDLSDASAAAITDRIRAEKRAGDVAVASVHWGSNWGYDVFDDQIRFAHRLVDGGVDVVHGHSSHHPRPIEVYRDRLVLYGCGDFIDDYEGISGYEAYRDDLRVMYFASVEPDTGRLSDLRLVPMQARRLRLERASQADSAWLRTTLDRVSRPFGSRLHLEPDGSLTVARRHDEGPGERAS